MVAKNLRIDRWCLGACKAFEIISAVFILSFSEAAFSVACNGEANAQEVVQTTQDQMWISEFIGLMQRVIQGTDLEDRREAALRALELEPRIENWTLQEPREKVRAVLNAALGMLYGDRIVGDGAENLEIAIKSLEATLVYFTKENYPKEWATVKLGLGIALCHKIKGGEKSHVLHAMKYLGEALQIFSRATTPKEWASAKMTMGAILLRQAEVAGGRELFENAISALNEALTVYSKAETQNEWARTQVDLAVAYGRRVDGSRAENLERAIEANLKANEVFTKKTAPSEWAFSQSQLGIIYRNRVFGDHGENIENSIGAFENALTVQSKEINAEDWATSKNGLANSYDERAFGLRSVNIELAIKAYESALEVLTQEKYPSDWAMVVANLGSVYAKRAKGDPDENFNQAVTLLEKTLKVRSKEAMPSAWAETQIRLTDVLLKSEGKRRKRSAAYERALLACQNALTIYTKREGPQRWARAPRNLGSIYHKRFVGYKEENLALSLRAFRSALEVFTKEENPLEWAAIQNDLGWVYQERTRGGISENHAQAVTAFNDALSIYTPEKHPREYLTIKNWLATTLLSDKNVKTAIDTFSDAHHVFLELLASGLDLDDASALMHSVDFMFEDWAYGLMEDGRLEEALDIVSEGRARMMAIALKQQKLNLSSEKLDRVKELRSEIDEWSRQASYGGDEGAQATQFINTLKKELSHLLAEGVENSPEAHAVNLLPHILPDGGVLVIPIMTEFRGKILFAIRSGKEISF